MMFNWNDEDETQSSAAEALWLTHYLDLPKQPTLEHLDTSLANSKSFPLQTYKNYFESWV